MSTLDFRNDTWRLDFSAKGISLGEGRRVWIGGEQDNTDFMVGRHPREVMIPPEKCVYHWLGCEGKRVEYNYCEEHLQETQDLYPGELGGARQVEQPRCIFTDCKVKSTSESEYCLRHVALLHAREYYAAHQDDEEARKTLERAEHSETEIQRKRVWRAKHKDRANAYERARHAVRRGRVPEPVCASA